MNRREFTKSVLAGASLIAAPSVVRAQAIELKLAYFVGDQHAMSQWLIKWSNILEKESGGRITVKRFPGSQMGPVQQHYDFVRTGQADVAWFLHGATPGRFPLTEIVQVPYLVGSAEIGTKVLNDAGIAGEISRRRAQGREGAAADDASARQRAHHQEADPHGRRHEGTAHPLRVADHPRFHRRARRDAGRRAADRAGRATAEGHDRRRLHRLRRRRHRVQDGRHAEIFDRDVLLRVELRRGHEPGLSGTSCRPTCRRW